MQVDKTLATDGGSSFYVFCIAYDEKNPQHSANSRNAVDYKEVLNDEDFAVFSKLRELRKECAEQFGRPVYAVFTNEQLAKMVTGKVYKPADMRKIDGIGESKMADYSKRFLDFLQSVYSLEP